MYRDPSGQPCYNATCSSLVLQPGVAVEPGLRDRLARGRDRVLLQHPETNYYAQRQRHHRQPAAYTQAGALQKIEYGLRAGAVYGHTPAGQVTFTVGTARTDVPTDLTCASKASCDVNSPTFWSKYQLTGISTQALEGSTLANVDSWTMAQTYPSTNDPTSPASLWLSSITHTGADTDGGGSSASVPAVSFSGHPYANRVMTPADLSDGYSIITRERMTQITEETGGQIGIAYDTPGGACTSGNFPAPDANTALVLSRLLEPAGGERPGRGLVQQVRGERGHRG